MAERKMNTSTAMATDNVRPIRLPVDALPNEKEAEKPQPSGIKNWILRRLHDLRVIAMEDVPTPPYWNMTMATAWVAVIVGILTVIGMVAGLWYFTWQTAHQAGYDQGKAEAEKQQMQKQIDEQAADLKRQSEMLKMVVNPPPEEKK